MVITVERLFRNIVSNYPYRVDQFDFADIIDLINYAYVEVRDEYIKNNEAQGFAISQKIDEFEESDFPYFNTAELDRAVLHSVPLDTAVIGTVIRTAQRLDDEELQGKNFNPEDVRNYSPGNNLKYFEGDVVFEDGKAYRALETNINDTEDSLEFDDRWEQVFFMRKDVGFRNIEVVDYKLADRHKVTIDAGMPVMTALQKDLYVSKDVTEIRLEYLGEHEDFTDFDDEMLMPDRARKAIRDMVISEMLQEANVQVREEEEEENE